MTRTDRTTLHRYPDRGSHDETAIAAVLDEALICHVGFNDPNTGPVVIPTIHVRVEDRIYLHGSPAGRMMRTLKKGAEVSLTATIVDGLVLATSAFHHSMNYRSVVVFGSGREVTDPDEKVTALDAITDKIMPGRRTALRPMTPKELAGTLVVAIDVTEASLKQRSGPSGETEAWNVWTGVVPLRLAAGEPIADPSCDLEVPGHVSAYLDRHR